MPSWPAWIRCRSRRGARIPVVSHSSGLLPTGSLPSGLLPKGLFAKRLLRNFGKGESGQGTVEFCLVVAGFLAVLLGAWAMLKGFSQGMLPDHALSSAAHSLSASPAGVLADILSV